MQAARMQNERDKGRATAAAARITAAAQDAAAARACVAQLEREVVAARSRVFRLELRLARIEGTARRALARTRDDGARLALGDICVTAGERNAPEAV